MLDDNKKRNKIYNLDFFKALKKNDRDCVKSNIDFIWKRATAESRINEIDFTPHGEPHIMDLLTILNDCFYLPMIKAVNNHQLSQNQILSSKELLFLIFSILSHDVGMHLDECGDEERNQHAQYAYEWVNQAFRENLSQDSLSVLGGNAGINIIGQICGAHSDYKGKPDYLEIKKLKEEQTLQCGTQKVTIRTRLLAAVLRFCDELDTCEDRLKGLCRSEPDENAASHVWESYLNHWQICELLKMPKVIEVAEANISYCIKFDINLEKIGQLTTSKNIYNKNNKVSFSRLLRKLYDFFENLKRKKINFFDAPLEGGNYSDECSLAAFFRKAEVKNFFHDGLIAKSNIEEKYYEWQNNYIKFLIPHYKDLESFIKDAKNGHIISHKCLNYIEEYKGHKSPCLHDYINMHKIIEPNLDMVRLKKLLLDSFGGIIDKVLEHTNPENCIIIGIDSIGSLLATILGTEKFIPVLSYSSSLKKNTYPKIELCDDALKKYGEAVKDKEQIFLISDVIYTFASMAKCLIDIGCLNNDTKKIEDEILNKINVFCLFDRKPAELMSDHFFANSFSRINAYDQLSSAYKIYALDDEKKARFIKSSECIYCMLK